MQMDGGLFFGPPLVGAKLVFPGLYSAENPGSLVDLLVNEKNYSYKWAPAIFLPMLHYIEKMDPKPRFNNLRMLSGATEPPLALMKKNIMNWVQKLYMHTEPARPHHLYP